VAVAAAPARSEPVHLRWPGDEDKGH
jgi:hypothetical protein